MPGWLDTNPSSRRTRPGSSMSRSSGSYAIQPTWGDGHATGFHTFMLLRDMSVRPCTRERERDTASREQPSDRQPALAWRRSVIIATTPFIAGHRVAETQGQVFGLVVRSRGLGGNLLAGLRSIAGGEIHEYTSLLEDTRRQAIDRMVQNATMVGGNAVISMRFDSSELAGTMSEIVAYGTAVVLVPDASAAQPGGDLSAAAQPVE